MGQLVGNYCKARKSVRQAAEAAGTVRERVVKGDELKVRMLVTVVFAWSLGFGTYIHTKRIGERPPQQQTTGRPV